VFFIHLSWSCFARTLELASRECESGAALCAVACEPPLADDTVRYFMDMRMTDDDGSSAARVGTGEPAICTAANRVARLQNRCVPEDAPLVGNRRLHRRRNQWIVRPLVQTPLVVWLSALRDAVQVHQ